MLHQYPSQQYSNLTSHYSPLDNCSHLLERTFLQPTKLTELDDCVVEQNGFFVEDKFQLEMENECHAYDTTPQEVSAEDDETKALVPTSVCELLDPPQPVADTKDCDTETSQLINDEQNNNHVEKSPIKNESYDYQKYDSAKEENDLLPFINLDVDTIINAPAEEVRAHAKLAEADERELKRKMQQLTADELRALCEDAESGFRLPGFHQAFGSTEIGRYVHPKDFIEQIESPPIIVPAPQLPHPLPPPHLARPGGHLCATPPNGAAHAALPNGAKMKSQRHPKRGKTAPPPASDGRAACWSYDPSAAPPDAGTCAPANGAYYKQRKEARRPPKAQLAVDGCAQPHPAYYNGGGAALGADDYYGCSSSSSSSSYYGGGGGGGGGCSDYANCEYFRYQQGSQYPASGYASSPAAASSSCSSYGGHSAAYGAYNGYAADEHCQRLQPYASCGSPAAAYGSGHHGQGWRGERFFPYGDQFPYSRYKQNGGGGGSSAYGGGGGSVYQNYSAGSQAQYLQSAQPSYPGYGYGAHPAVPNYSYF